MTHRFLLPALCALVATTVGAHAQYTNGQNATAVLGQFNFSSNASSLTQSTFNGAAGTVVDASSGKIFVADTANNRILRFPATAASSNGAAAEAVFGQGSFSSNTTGASTLAAPSGIALDSSGNLWVADSGNNRVVMFPSAVTGNSTDAPSIYLGQPNASSTTAGTSQINLRGPNAVAVDSSGNLYVADSGNNRVVKFASAASLSTGAFATSVVGQSNWLASNATLSAGGLNNPSGLLIDSSNNLWVADSGNNRVLRFLPSSLSGVGPLPGATASGVLGQGNFTTNASATSANGLSNPVGLAIDQTGRLYVGDSANNRVVTFDGAASAANGSNATFVLGQTDFISSTTGLSAGTFNLPQGVAYLASTNQLFVVDTNNSRLLGFTRIPGLGIPNMAPKTPKVRAGSSRDFLINIVTSNATDSYKITITPASSTTSTAKFKFYVDGKQVTSAVNKGNYFTGQLTKGSTFSIAGLVQTQSTAKNKLRYNVKVQSTTSASSTASKNFAITVNPAK